MTFTQKEKRRLHRAGDRLLRKYQDRLLQLLDEDPELTKISKKLSDKSRFFINLSSILGIAAVHATHNEKTQELTKLLSDTVKDYGYKPVPESDLRRDGCHGLGTEFPFRVAKECIDAKIGTH